MGTNYYLIKKCNKDEFTNAYNDDYKLGNDFRKLTNGYIYKNTYYPTIDDLEKDLALTLHIGKSSCGWHFSLCIYPKLGIKGLDDWKKLFSEHEIYDEYGDLISADKMLSIITERAEAEYMELGQEAYEAKIVERHNDLCKSSFNGFAHIMPVKDYDEYLENNHACRGLYGLLAHKEHTGFYSFEWTDGTYDLTEQWDYC